MQSVKEISSNFSLCSKSTKIYYNQQMFYSIDYQLTMTVVHFLSRYFNEGPVQLEEYPGNVSITWSTTSY